MERAASEIHMKDLVEYIDRPEPAPKKRGPYKKKAA
jgi:hypothetical protein